MTNIYLTDSDEKAIVDFVKDHKSYMTRRMNISRTRPGRNAFGRGLPTAASCLSECARLGSQKTRYGELTQSKSSQAPKEITEKQNWIQDRFNLLEMHIRCKGLCKSSAFKTPAQGASASAASAHDISKGSTNTDSIEIIMHSDTTIQPSVTSPSAVFGNSLLQLPGI